MFKNEYQGGPFFEVFSPQHKDATCQWKVTGAVRKSYEKEVKSYAYSLEGSTATTKMQLPKDARTTLYLVQRYLIVQLYLKKGLDFSMELGVVDMKNSKRRIFLSTAQKDIHTTPLHAKIPLKIVKSGNWVNLCIDLVSMVSETWRGETFKLLDQVVISANCLLRKIFTMRNQPPDTVGDDELYGCSPSNTGELDQIPKQCQFASDVNHSTQLITVDKIKHAERLRVGGDVRGSVTSALDLDLSHSDRRSSATPNDSFHIAFGSKVAGVRTSQSAGKKSARDLRASHIVRRRTISGSSQLSNSTLDKYRGGGNLTNRSIRGHSRAEDGVSSSGYHDMAVSVTSQDSMYTGRDPGGGVRQPGVGGTTGDMDPPMHIPNPPDSVRTAAAAIRSGHQRQYSDPSSVLPMGVQPHPPREPSYERVRRRPRVKNGSAGKDRLSSAGSQKDEGINSASMSQHNSHTDATRRARVVSDGDLLNTSSSSNESGPRQRSAEHVRKPPIEIRVGKTQHKEYRPSNYQHDGVEDSVSDVIDILRHQMDLDGVDDHSDGEGMEHHNYQENGSDQRDMYLFVSQPKPAPRQKNSSPSQFLEAVAAKVNDTPPKSIRTRAKDSTKYRGPRPEEDFINDGSSDSDDDDRYRVMTGRQSSRPNSGSRPGSGTRPNSGSRPGSGSRLGSNAHPNSGSRAQARAHVNSTVSPKIVHKHLTGTHGNNVTSDSDYGSYGAISSDHASTNSHGVVIPNLKLGTDGEEFDGPAIGGSPTFYQEKITDRSCVSRMSRKSLREVPMSDSRFSQTQEDEKPYDFSKYEVQDLSASAELRMLEEIQGERSVEFEPVNMISPRKDPPMGRSPPRSHGGLRVGMSLDATDDSPTMISDDDTSFSTWKAPPAKSHNYQHEMRARLSSDTLTSSNPRDWSGVCSPPVLRGAPGSNSLDDVSNLSNNSPRKGYLGGSARNTDDEEELDLLYDPQLNWFFDANTSKYYELV